MSRAIVLVTFLWVASSALAQSSHVVRATGEASVTGKADRVLISIGVQTHAATAAAASAENAKTTTAVLEAVKTALAASGEVKTAGYSISPDYVYVPNTPPKLNGYNANNSLQVTLDDVSLTGKIIDTATGAGANNINGVSFILRDDTHLKTQALEEAAATARANAEAIAKALHLSVKGVLEAETSDAVVQPIPVQGGGTGGGVMSQMAMRVASPMAPGNIEVHASVVVTLSVE